MYVCIVFFMCVLVCLHLLRFVREESRKRRHRMTFVICSHFLINFRKRGKKITHNAHRYTLTHMRRHARTFALISFPCARHTHTYTYTCYLAAVHVLHTFYWCQHRHYPVANNSNSKSELHCAYSLIIVVVISAGSSFTTCSCRSVLISWPLDTHPDTCWAQQIYAREWLEMCILPKKSKNMLSALTFSAVMVCNELKLALFSVLCGGCMLAFYC